MTDGIIKGTGNSRYLKSVANFMALYPTYEAFAQALIAGTLPVDLYGVNAGGWQVRGSDINKASLLKDATASLYGKGTAATVDDILAAIRPLITAAQTTADSKALISTGSFTGSGTGGSRSISFSRRPKIVFFTGNDDIDGYARDEDPTFSIAIYGQTTIITSYASGLYKMLGVNAVWSDRSLKISFPSDVVSNQNLILNAPGKTYHYAYI